MSGPEIKKQDILAASKGMLQKQMYVVHTFPTDGMGPVMENIEPHLKFQIELEEKGIMFGAGPFWDDAEEKWEGEGMVIIRAGSLSEAKEIAASDPMHSSGARDFTVRPWLMNEGTVTVKIRYSDGSRELI
ncbi:MAG: YciI family protein [Pseudomonadota bacterium]|nr:YciI family protein [Pseudomonadota bacterium]